MNKLDFVWMLSIGANIVFGILTHFAIIRIHALEAKIKVLQGERFSIKIHEVRDENDIVL